MEDSYSVMQRVQRLEAELPELDFRALNALVTENSPYTEEVIALRVELVEWRRTS
jgi:hypothetical protein